MKIVILSNLPRAYSTVRLKEAARARGHQVRVLRSSHFALNLEPGKPELLYKGQPLEKIDAVIPRIGSSLKTHGVAVLQQFEQMGVYSLNSYQAVSIARDKLRSMQLLSKHQVEIPPSSFVFNRSDIDAALEKVGGAPVIVKLLRGSQGTGVILAEKKNVAKAIIEALQVARREVLIQKFVKESSGRDIRAFVIGGKVVAAMRRIAQGDEFRSNVHLGATTEAVELNDEYKEMALKAAHIVGLRVAGVDMLETEAGPKVLEVNSSPGLEGIETSTNLDIAGEIISYLEEQVQFPDLDIFEKLQLRKGYSIAEITVGQKSLIINENISSKKLDELEVKILRIEKSNNTIYSPKPEEKIELGDKLLCYGKQSNLKKLLPPAKRSEDAPEELTDKEISDTKEISEQEPLDLFPFTGDILESQEDKTS